MFRVEMHRHFGARNTIVLDSSDLRDTRDNVLDDTSFDYGQLRGVRTRTVFN